MTKFSLYEHLYYGPPTQNFFLPNINKTNKPGFVKIAINILNLLKTEAKAIMCIPLNSHRSCENFDSLVQLT